MVNIIKSILKSAFDGVFYFQLILRNWLSRENFERIPESSQLTEDDQNVLEYDQAMDSALAIYYVLSLEVIHRTGLCSKSAKALDLACGPGQFTLAMAKILSLESVLGLDLSSTMIECCKKKLSDPDNKSADFDIGDVTDLSRFSDAEFQLTTFMDAAHHLPTLEHVTKTLAEMDRVTSPKGLVFVIDVARLSSKAVTKAFVEHEGKDNIAKGYTRFQSDFSESMYAAWTVSELKSCIPTNGRRRWIQIRPKFLPSMHFILGVPHDHDVLFPVDGFPWAEGESPLPERFSSQTQLLRMLLGLS